MPVPLPLRGLTCGDMKMVSGRGDRLRCGADALDAAWAAIALPPAVTAGWSADPCAEKRKRRRRSAAPHR